MSDAAALAACALIAVGVGSNDTSNALGICIGCGQRLVEETADLLYHLLVLLARRDLPPSEVWAELRGRHSSP